MDIIDEENLNALSMLLRPAMELRAIDSHRSVSRALAKFADERHRVGPLLHLACKSQNEITFENGAAAILNESHKKNVFTSLRQHAVEKELAEIFSSAAIEFSFLKGLGLSKQLHGEPAIRQSKDIDIMIPVEKSAAAINALNEAGYIYAATTLRNKKLFSQARQGQDIAIFKDLTFFDPNFSIPVELHARLFKYEPTTFSSAFSDAIKFENHPSLSNSFYCLYLILHGALAMWPRLKWLVDLSLLMRKMPPQNRSEMMMIAHSFGCEIAVASSLVLAGNIFPGSLDNDWSARLEKHQKTKLFYELSRIFMDSLNANSVSDRILPLRYHLVVGSAELVFAQRLPLFRNLCRRWLTSMTIRI